MGFFLTEFILAFCRAREKVSVGIKREVKKRDKILLKKKFELGWVIAWYVRSYERREGGGVDFCFVFFVLD